MNVVVAGLSPRDEAAFGFFLNRSMKGWSWSSTPAGRGTVLPKADLLVADLVALGLAQWSVAAEAELLRVLHGNTAVLLLPANDQTWATMNPETVRQHTLVWLQKPYGTEDMRQALENAAAARKAAQAPPPMTQGLSKRGATASSAGQDAKAPRGGLDGEVRTAAVSPVIKAVLPTVSFKAATKPDPVPRHDHGDDIPGLTVQQLQARLAVLPDAGRHPFLRTIAAMLEQGQPFEARFTVHNSVIFHPADGWVASNTPTAVIERVCQSDALAAAVTVRAIDGIQADERAHRLGMNLRELSTFLWALASAALDGKR
jgi:hypothetical protein